MNLSQLIREARQGSAAAQKCLFDHFSGKMLALCIRYVRNRETAEEILSDGFFKFFRALADFNYQGDAALYAWLKKIMVNECLMHQRSQKVFVVVAEPEAEAVAWNGDSLDKLSTEEIFRLIVRLPEGYRTVFNLFHIEGWNHREIALALGVSEVTSRTQLSKARSLLQKMLVQNGTDYVKRKNG